MTGELIWVDWVTLGGILAILLACFGALVWAAAVLIDDTWRARYPRELTPREEAARQQAVQSFVEGRPFAREDTVLYLSEIWEVAKVSPSGALLHLQHSDGRETVVEARLVQRLSRGPLAKSA